jgi:site-specific DNA-methyltransferase (cytosine-N4-specific)
MQVEKEDWDFAGADTQYSTHGLHPYPARMIPQIARRLIVRYSKPGPDTVVLDPFAGSGGVLVEASLKLTSELVDSVGARKSVGIDINPLALLLARAKTTPIEPDLLRKTGEPLLERIRKGMEDVKHGKRIARPPRFFNIDYWFKPNVKLALQLVREELSRITEQPMRPFFDACFSRTIREVSNTRSGEFKLFRIPKKQLEEYDPEMGDVFDAFERAMKNGIARMEEYYAECETDDWARPLILEEDTRRRTSIPDSSVDLVVTSPPYGDSRTTVAYGQFSRLSMQWLGIDGAGSKSLDKRSLGGVRCKSLSHELRSKTLSGIVTRVRRRDGNRARDVLSFFIDLEKCLVETSRVMSTGGHVCIVIGDRTVKGVTIPTGQIISELASGLDFATQTTYERSIPTKRMPWENSPSNVAGEKGKTMHEEHIIVLRKI